MGYERRFEADGVLVTNGSGKIHLPDIIEAMEGLVDITNKKEIYGIIDYHQVSELNLSVQEMNLLIKRLKKALTIFNQGAIAFISDRDSVYGVCRAIQIQLESEQMQMNVFRSLKNARTWIKKKKAQNLWKTKNIIKGSK